MDTNIKTSGADDPTGQKESLGWSMWTSRYGGPKLTKSKIKVGIDSYVKLDKFIFIYIFMYVAKCEDKRIQEKIYYTGNVLF